MLELFGTAACPYTRQVREDLRWSGRPFVEHDVDADATALRRMLALTGGDRTVPVIVEDDRVLQVGYEGRGCYAGGG